MKHTPLPLISRALLAVTRFAVLLPPLPTIPTGSRTHPWLHASIPSGIQTQGELTHTQAQVRAGIDGCVVTPVTRWSTSCHRNAVGVRDNVFKQKEETEIQFHG